MEFSIKQSMYITQLKKPGHHGIDFVVADRIVKSFSNGIVVRVGFDVKGFGNFCTIYDPKEKVFHRYGHFDWIGVRVGELVVVGQTIGKMGNTGKVVAITGDGSHVHWEVFTSTVIDPKLYGNASNTYKNPMVWLDRSDAKAGDTLDLSWFGEFTEDAYTLGVMVI